MHAVVALLTLVLVVLTAPPARAWRPSYAAKRMHPLWALMNGPMLDKEMSEKRFGFVIGTPRSGWLLMLMMMMMMIDDDDDDDDDR